jgi:hypothetical protein
MARHLLPILVGAFATAAVVLAVALAATRHGDSAGGTVAAAGAPRAAPLLDARAASWGTPLGREDRWRASSAPWMGDSTTRAHAAAESPI